MGGGVNLMRITPNPSKISTSPYHVYFGASEFRQVCSLNSADQKGRES